MSSNKTFPIVFKASVHFICFLSQVSDIPLDYDIANNYSCLDLYILLFLWLEFLCNPLPPEIICLFILFVLSRIKLVLHFVVNVIISVAERKNNNTVFQFVQKCKNSMFVIFILLVKILHLFNLLLSTRKSVAEKKDICHLNLYVKYEQNRWLRHCKIKSLFHETKQFNFPEKNVPSQICLAWVSSQ